jgi:hypothetical protein
MADPPPRRENSIMSILLASAKRIAADFSTMGAQQFTDAERDLRCLHDAALVLVRQGLEESSQDDVDAIRKMIDQIDERREEWAARLTETIATRHPTLTLAWSQGTDDVVQLVEIEMKNLEDDDRVEIVADGVGHVTTGLHVGLDGETLFAENPLGDMIFELPLKEVAAFGFVDTEGTMVGWTGFNVLTLDDRLITLR